MHGQFKLACLLILQAIVALPAAGESIPIELFSREDELKNLKLSPDGQFVAAVAGNRSEGLAFIDVKDGRLANLVKMQDEERIFDFEWVTPKRVVVLAELRGSERVLRGPIGDLFTAERDGTAIVGLYGSSTENDVRPQAALVSTLKGRDDDAILISLHPSKGPILQLPYYTLAAPRRPTLGRFVLSKFTGPVEPIPLIGARMLADQQDMVRFAVGYDREGALVMLWRPTIKAAWTSVDLPRFRYNSISLQRFSADNRAVTFVAAREGESLNALYSLDLASEAITKLYQHPKGDIAETVTDLRSGAVAGVLVHGDRPEYHWLDESSMTAQLYQMLGRSFAGQTVRVTSASEDGNMALLLVNSDTNPGDYYVFDVPRRQANFLLAARKGLNPAQLHAKQGVQIPARDGVTLPGYVTRPAASKGPLSMIVLPHDGLPGARDTWDFDAQVQLLASRGYAVLQVNFRGSGGYGADFEAEGHRQWGARMQDDISDATRWAIQQGIASADRICIYGVGYGGYAAVMGTVREPTLYRCAVGYSGIYDLELLVKSEKLSEYRRGASRYSDLFFGRDAGRLRQRSPVYNVERIQVPVLLIHGKRDRRADLGQALRMKSALQRRNKSHELAVLDNSGPDPETMDRTEAYEKLLGFFEQYLATPPSQ